MAANSKFAVATNILTSLALISEEPDEAGLINSAYIASSVNTNAVVVRRIVSELVKAGLVISHQGKGGGLELGKSPEKITLLDVYEAMGEMPLFAYNPNKPNPKCPVSVKMAQILKPVFSEVQNGVKERLEEIKLSDLVHKIA
ncbi:MAG: Rrf2 family transcriptional regulator [Nitrospirae bacterium]|nr:Rrf2 family transcriptional regulator [Nitrospirota bacterium]